MEKVDNLGGWLEGYVHKRPVFRDLSVLSDTHIPETLRFRGPEIMEISKTLSPILRGGRPSNLFIYGKPGSGKTVSMRHIKNTFDTIAKKNGVDIDIIYVNCSQQKSSDTEYRLVVKLNQLVNSHVPSRGLNISELYDKFIKTFDERKRSVVLVFDEIDILLKNSGDSFLYTFSRINPELENSKVSIIGITNVLSLLDNLEPRTRSSLCPQEMVFQPYNATQLRDILTDRAKLAFHNGVAGHPVVSKCAALAAQEHGDARRAIELLRVSGEIAEKEGNDKIELKDVDVASEKITFDNVMNIVRSQPKQCLFVLYSILQMFMTGKTNFQTGDVMDSYSEIAKTNGYRILNQCSVSNIISELDIVGVIKTKTVYRGRYGNTREIHHSLSLQTMKSIISKIEEEITPTKPLKRFEE